MMGKRFKTASRWVFTAPTVILALGLLLCTACDDAAPTEEDLAGVAYEVGQATKAKYPRSERMRDGKIHALYGRVAQVNFNNGRRHWVDVKDLEPEGSVRLLPDGDACKFEKDDRVLAQRSKSGRTVSGKLLSSMQRGKLMRAHGKMAQVEFGDGGLDWAACASMKVDDKPQDDAPPKADKDSPSKGNNPCVYRPSQKKYVRCTTFSAGKCKTGTRACKPAGKCVFRPEEGKHVRCSTFANGKCRSGKKPCKPSSKCMFRPDKGKYVQCSTFAAGKCKSGTRACQP